MKYPENPTIALININSVRNKFKTLVSLVNPDLDILIILETLNHQLFPHSKFMIDGFLLPYCLDRSAHSVSEVILLKCYSIMLLYHSTILSIILAIFIEMNIKCNPTYNPSKSLIEKPFVKDEHFVIVRDFNTDAFYPSITLFCILFKLKTF